MKPQNTILQVVYRIYKITNLINSKIYIGYTGTSLEERFKRHCSKGSHCHHMYNAIQKYGVENFSIEELICVSSLEEALEQERRFIAEYNSTNNNIGYNIRSGGNGADIWSDQQRQTHSILMSEVWQRDGAKLAQSSMMKEVWKRPNEKEKRSQIQQDTWASVELREKQKLTQQEIWKSEELLTLHSAALKRSWTPERKAKQSKRMKERYASQFERDKQSETQKLAWSADRKQEHSKLMLAIAAKRKQDND